MQKREKPFLKKKFVDFLCRIFRRKRYRLKNKHDYWMFLKNKTKNQLVRIAIDLRTKLSIDSQKARKKAERAMLKGQAKRKKQLKRAMRKEKGKPPIHINKEKGVEIQTDKPWPRK